MQMNTNQLTSVHADLCQVYSNDVIHAYHWCEAAGGLLNKRMGGECVIGVEIWKLGLTNRVIIIVVAFLKFK